MQRAVDRAAAGFINYQVRSVQALGDNYLIYSIIIQNFTEFIYFISPVSFASQYIIIIPIYYVNAINSKQKLQCWIIFPLSRESE